MAPLYSKYKYWVFLWMYYVLCTLCLLVISDRILANLIRLLGILIIFMYLLCTQEWQKSNEYVFPQGPQPTDYSELMNLVSAQQTTLQSQHAEIKQASILQYFKPKQSLSKSGNLACCISKLHMKYQYFKSSHVFKDCLCSKHCTHMAMTSEYQHNLAFSHYSVMQRSIFSKAMSVFLNMHYNNSLSNNSNNNNNKYHSNLHNPEVS